MKRTVLSVVTLSLGFLTFGQSMNNLVENPGFEQLTAKLKKGGQIDIATGWTSPTGSAADVYAEKYDKTGFGTPANNYGTEEPKEGENYAGFRAFSFGDKEARNYVSSKLKIPMKKGSKYCVKFYVSLSEGSKYASNNVGVNFSKKLFNIDDDRSIMGETHVKSVQNKPFNGFFGWDEVCGIYTAEGGEKFITIGNFTSTGETKNERMKKPKGAIAQTVLSAYYYLDDISVVQIDEETDCECQGDPLMNETSIIYEVAPLNPQGMKPGQILEYTSVYFGSNKAEFNDSDYEHLKLIVDALKTSPTNVTIEGHTDMDEVEDGNANVGLQRAEAVKTYLVKQGVSASLLTVANKKSGTPVDESGTDLAKAKNRRVEFVLQ